MSTEINLKSQLPTHNEYSACNYYLNKLKQDCQFLMDESKNINILQKEFYNSQMNLLIIFQYHMISLALWDRYSLIKANGDLKGFYDLDLMIEGMNKATLDIESLDNIKNAFNRNLFIDCWSMFETTTWDLYSKYIKPGASPHKINVKNRYENLYQKYYGKNYAIQFEEDLKFLNYFRIIRNAMHNNYIYHGVEVAPYFFNGVAIKFTNTKLIDFDPKPSHYYFVDLTLKLIAVAERLFVLINNKEGFENLVYNGEVPLDIQLSN